MQKAYWLISGSMHAFSIVQMFQKADQDKHPINILAPATFFNQNKETAGRNMSELKFACGK
jgi:hypothetical protein